ncbi:MAG: pyridoxal phosphate-dependent aminotransferase [Gammaproteobacteria bacterium]|nr:pyridoxal phosphate-dependent aminotransferase [Gammaproteobacteria bacterium]
MSISLSNRVKNIKPSQTLAITARARELREQGQDIIGLGAGEPDFDTPDHIKEAAIQAIRDGFTKYTAVDGTPSLKQAVINKFKRDNTLHYKINQILVSVGGKQTSFNLLQALINPGDEVIIPAPYWVSYPDMTLLAEGIPVIIPAGIEQGYKITPNQLLAAITARTKLIFINSPSNPTGAVYKREELVALGAVLKNYPDILIATDDMYEHILWTEAPFVNILNACPELYDRTLVMNGVSKAYSMTGWRIGYCGGPADLVAAMKKIQSQSTSNPCSISQAAAEAALNGDQECITPMLNAFKARHDFVVERLNTMNGVDCLKSDGTFYAFADFRKVIENNIRINNDVELADYLLAEAKVALVPGSAFGAEGYMRISYATSMEILDQALERIASAIN